MMREVRKRPTRMPAASGSGRAASIVRRTRSCESRYSVNSGARSGCFAKKSQRAIYRVCGRLAQLEYFAIGAVEALLALAILGFRNDVVVHCVRILGRTRRRHDAAALLILEQIA